MPRIVMKQNELRIGNWVHIGGKDTTIGELFDDGVTTDLDRHQYEYIYEVLKPIPLTEEWLLKFGFKEGQISTMVYEWRIADHRLQTDLHFFIWMGYKDGIEIKYVHQLQNLYFALTGEELKCL